MPINIPYGDDPRPQSACGICNVTIFWQSCPHGGWWIHSTHPADDHDAEGPEMIEFDDD